MYNNGKYQYIPFFVTVGVILAIDLFGIYRPIKGEGLLIGVVAGLIAAIGAILHGNLKNAYFFQKEQFHTGDVIKIHLSEEVSFLNKASIRETLDNIPENTIVNIDASTTQYIDFDVLELIKEFRDIKAPLKNIVCNMLGFHELYKMNSASNVQSGHW